MKAFFLFLLIALALAVNVEFAQNGGKAEPKRIQFAAGKSSATLTGTLSTDQEMEYVFGASKGQKVTITNATKSLFDFKVFSEANFPEGDFDSSPSYTFEIPETGDYMLTVRKKRVKRPKTGRFTLTVAIK